MYHCSLVFPARQFERSAIWLSTGKEYVSVKNALSALLVFALCLPYGAFAGRQTPMPQPTYFKAHRMGETFAEWTTAENINMDMCTKPKRDMKDACKRLDRIQAGANLDFSTTDGKQTRTFTFNSGTLQQIDIPQIMLGTSFEEQVSFLANKYGKPTSTKTVTYQNAMGAKWDCGEATWVMPDGAAILAIESIESLPITGLTRKLTVTIMSKERVQELSRAQQNKPNPY
jgi:hypothetical protein